MYNSFYYKNILHFSLPTGGGWRGGYAVRADLLRAGAGHQDKHEEERREEEDS